MAYQPKYKTLQQMLDELAVERCSGADEYEACYVHSLQAQAMARALLKLITDEERWPGQNGDHSELLDALKADFIRSVEREDGSTRTPTRSPRARLADLFGMSER